MHFWKGKVKKARPTIRVSVRTCRNEKPDRNLGDAVGPAEYPPFSRKTGGMTSVARTKKPPPHD
jgi:hypothetical protein